MKRDWFLVLMVVFAGLGAILVAFGAALVFKPGVGAIVAGLELIVLAYTGAYIETARRRR